MAYFLTKKFIKYSSTILYRSTEGALDNEEILYMYETLFCKIIRNLIWNILCICVCLWKVDIWEDDWQKLNFRAHKPSYLGSLWCEWERLVYYWGWTTQQSLVAESLIGKSTFVSNFVWFDFIGIVNSRSWDYFLKYLGWTLIDMFLEVLHDTTATFCNSFIIRLKFK